MAMETEVAKALTLADFEKLLAKLFPWPGPIGPDPAGPFVLKHLGEVDQIGLVNAALETSNKVLTAYQTAISAHVEFNKHVQTALSKAKQVG